jgi:hypothetical protein
MKACQVMVSSRGGQYIISLPHTTGNKGNEAAQVTARIRIPYSVSFKPDFVF